MTRLRTPLPYLLLIPLLVTATACSGGTSIETLDFAFADKETLAAPEQMAVAEHYVWFAVGGAVVPVDAESHEIGEPIELPDFPLGLAADGDAVWVALHDGTVARASRDISTLGEPVPFLTGNEDLLGSFSLPMAVIGDELWIALRQSIVRIDTQNGEALPAIPLAESLSDLAAGDGVVWASHSGHLMRLDATTGKATGDVELGESGGSLTVGQGEVWMTTSDGGLQQGSGRVHRIDAETLEPVADPLEFKGDNDLSSIAAGAGWLWGIQRSKNTVVRVDPNSGDVKERYSLRSPYSSKSAELGSLQFGAGKVWIGTRIGNRAGVIEPE